ncbi:MAG: aminotransferase class V-fold PLP-dependent enzyme [Anaerolineae bacterium]|nr:aminotransferase class V-fold PLP-dependent enzyme [Anaerolineae bacterium]
MAALLETDVALRQAYADFSARYPAYTTTRHLDDLRAAEYSRLDEQGHIYVDYTGGGLYADRQLREHMGLLQKGVFGNPHSSNPTSLAATELDEHARHFVLEYFNADPDVYTVIFTQNASGALKLVGESYPFAPGDRYVLTFDNHNSVNGVREFARARGASVHYIPVLPPDLRADASVFEQLLAETKPGQKTLFAYPGQSNFSGVQHPLDWIARAQAAGWDVLVDFAAFAPTNRLDLRQWTPDFVDLSFYKLFGYPTGIGALIARKDKLAKLQRPWFAGGTITMASVQGDGYYLAEGERGFEDGTINYLNIPAVEIGLRFLQSVGIDAIHTRVMALAGWLLDQLLSLQHSNGKPLVRLYGPTTTEGRGGTVTINLFDPDGHLFDFRDVERAANERQISLRTGCFCNPGAGEVANNLTADDMRGCFGQEERLTFEEFLLVMDGRASGAVRISLGIVSNFSDVYHLMQFVRTFVDRSAGR